MLGLIGGIASSIIGGGMSLLGQSSANKQAQENSQAQMDFQERMSSTAYTRAAADMQRAGLNKAMMFGGGGPASTPAGAAAPVGNTMGQAGEIVSHTMSSAMQSSVYEKQLDQMASIIALQGSQKRINDATVPNITAATPGIVSDSERKAVEAKLAAMGLSQAEIKDRIARLQLGFSDADLKPFATYQLAPGVMGEAGAAGTVAKDAVTSLVDPGKDGKPPLIGGQNAFDTVDPLLKLLMKAAGLDTSAGSTAKSPGKPPTPIVIPKSGRRPVIIWPGPAPVPQNQ